MNNSIGAVMLDLSGTALASEERELLRHPSVGGIILFSRNYQSPEQLGQLVREIRAAAPNKRLLIGVDQEGGRVQRFTEGFTLLPALAELGASYDKNPTYTKQLIIQCAWLMASELLSVGIDFSFAPVLDLDYGNSAVIATRSFHRNPKLVAELGRLYWLGMQQAGMAAVGKHFPGHGYVSLDSHVALPVDERPLAAILAEDGVPFQCLIAAGLPAIMPAHISFPAVDPLPVGFSTVWLQQILRHQFNFNGAILSDDLAMAGASAIMGYHERAQAALRAGCDMALICNHRSGALAALEKPLELLDPQLSATRLAHLRGHFTLTYQELRQSQQWQIAHAAVKLFRESAPNHEFV